MPSTKGYLDFILEQLSGLEDVTYRAMMGEYILYYRGRIIGGVYDDRFLVKPVAAARESEGSIMKKSLRMLMKRQGVKL